MSLLRGAVLIALAAVLGCGREAPAPPRSGQPEHIALLAAALTDSVRLDPSWRSYAPMASDSMHVVTRPSRVVPGLVYHVARFTPPRTADGSPFVATVVERAGRMRVLGTTADWAAVAAWSPADSATAAAACAELVPQTTYRLGLQTIVGEPDDLEWTSPEDSALITQRAAPPAARRAGQGWLATIWAIQTERTIEYHCAFAPDGGLSISRGDSLSAGHWPT